MKRTLLFPVTIGLVAISLFTACEPVAEITPPLVTVNPVGDQTAKPGDTVAYEMLINSDSELKTASFSASMNSTPIASKDSVFAAGVEEAILNIHFIVPSNMADGSVITLAFTASNTEVTTITRTLNVVIPPGEIFTYTAIIMSDLENPIGKSFYSIEDNKLMNINQAIAASAEIDLIYYYGATNKASLCAPADKPVEAFEDSHNESIVKKFTTRNDTKLALVTMTTADFAAVTNDVPIKAKTPTATGTAVTTLAKDNIVWAETVTGKKALIRVVNITGTQASSEITIEVKVQK